MPNGRVRISVCIVAAFQTSFLPLKFTFLLIQNAEPGMRDADGDTEAVAAQIGVRECYLPRGEQGGQPDLPAFGADEIAAIGEE